MNTRLQVEHPVTELVTGLDLVELQIRIAAGEPLPIRQDDVRFTGHAIEARLYAEAPHRGFLPQSGRSWPGARPRAPASASITASTRARTVSPFYDPLLAKIVAHGATREEARRRLIQALEDTTALGIATNRGFLIDCLHAPEFAAGKATTEFIPKHFAKPAAPAPDDAASRPGRRSVVRGERPAAWPRPGAHLVLQRCARLAAEDRGRRKAVARSVTVLGPRRYRIDGGESPSELQFAAADSTAR